MPDCPVCLGEGQHDFRDDDARWYEEFSDDQLRRMRARGLQHPLGIKPCLECEGTGVVSEERAKDMQASAIAYVDQLIARALEDDAKEEA